MLAIIPARAGSKGIKGKNRLLFCGKPLLEWTLDAAKLSKSVSEIVLTTDDVEIIENYDLKRACDYILRRPPELSSDDAPASGYIYHALTELSIEQRHEFFCVLQPTSPLRLASDIDGLLERTVEGGFNSGVTVVKVPHNFGPESLMRQNGNYVEPLTPVGDVITLRQDKGGYFARNGAAVYVCRVDFFMRTESLFDRHMAYFEMPAFRSVDIDSQEDFDLAELYMRTFL